MKYLIAGLALTLCLASHAHNQAIFSKTGDNYSITLLDADLKASDSVELGALKGIPFGTWRDGKLRLLAHAEDDSRTLITFNPGNPHDNISTAIGAAKKQNQKKQQPGLLNHKMVNTSSRLAPMAGNEPCWRWTLPAKPRCTSHNLKKGNSVSGWSLITTYC